eukprot:TRINITY_DN6841_c0_g1_i1.p1 TRINITY_DN6841_c0_g1~~TRINITY_DN6841_c0_g1_i1.p1  ORF type:complete len:443 (-),score=82.04 TRINITY_DN6841_c0_g1_i1:19-1347(-)
MVYKSDFDVDERKPLLKGSPLRQVSGQSWDSVDAEAPVSPRFCGCDGVFRSLIDTFVAFGNAVAGLLFTGILLLLILRLADVRQLSLVLGLRAELDRRGDNEIRFQELTKWATDNGAKGLDRLTIDFFDPGSLQLVKSLAAARDVGPAPQRPDGSQVSHADAITIPPEVILSQAHSTFLSSPFANTTGSPGLSEIDHAVMVFLAVERRRVLGAGRQSSFWAPLIRLLPTPQDYSTSHPLYATHELLKSYSVLPATHKVLEQQLVIEHLWDRKHELWEQQADGAGVKGFSFEDFKWAFTAFTAHGSKLYDINAGRNITAMVSVINLLSPTGSSQHANAVWDFYGSPPTVRLELLPGVRQGDELFEATSQLGRTNDEVFTWTGGILKENSQEVTELGKEECDALAVSVATSPDDPQQLQIQSVLQSLAQAHCKKRWVGSATKLS